ncbi:MAG TPA: GDSL-type esterase/lipase family protein [Holophaga sp.]|nr:GDSL-type esterase/lipase family protein [Holophaga sp.]
MNPSRKPRWPLGLRSLLLVLTAAGLGSGLNLSPLSAAPRHKARRAKPARSTHSTKAAKSARIREAAPEPRIPAIANPQALQAFWGGLATLGQTSTTPGLVRVLQFGDSHTAADFWTGRLRSRLQQRFGDGGPGLILPSRPWRGYAHVGVGQSGFSAWTATSLRAKECDGWVGLAGAAMIPPGTPESPLRFTGTFTEFRIHLLGGATDHAEAEIRRADAITLAPAETSADGNGGRDGDLPPVPLAIRAAFPLPDVLVDPAPRPTATVQNPEPAPSGAPPARMESILEKPLSFGQMLKIQGRSALEAGLKELTLNLPTSARLLGVELRSGRSGVIVDELGLNGAEILDLERWNPELRGALLAQAHPDLIILAYGTNDMGRKDITPEEYGARARKLLSSLKQESGASILVVGPLDRIGRNKRQIPNLKAGARWVIDALRQAALDSDCAFWDARQAMGGEGAILRWNRAGLAQKDLVHLTGPGYQKLGDAMADALLEAFEAASPAK